MKRLISGGSDNIGSEKPSVIPFVALSVTEGYLRKSRISRCWTIISSILCGQSGTPASLTFRRGRRPEVFSLPVFHRPLRLLQLPQKFWRSSKCNLVDWTSAVVVLQQSQQEVSITLNQKNISTSIFCMRIPLGKTRLHDFFLYRPITCQGPRIWSLHCNFNGEISQKFDFVITFDWKVLLT